MDNKFNQKDFEHFIKQNADQYRMFPSDKVWKGIHNTLHTRRRWYGIGLILLILTTTVVSWVMLSTTGKNRTVISSLPPVIAKPAEQEVKEPAKIVIAPVKKEPNSLSFITTPSSLQQEVLFTDTYDQDIANHSVPNVLADQSPLPLENSKPALVFEAEPVAVSEKLVAKTPSVPKQVTNRKPVEFAFTAEYPKENNLPAPETAPVNSMIVYLEQLNRNRSNDYPMTIESVINSFQYQRRRKKISLQAYVTPTVSYRQLTENKAFISWARNQNNSNMINATYSSDIEEVVTHKPDLGMQFGFSAGFPISKKLRFISALQFNVSKYDIRAYNHPSELTTISLSAAAGAGGRNTSVYAYSDYRNAGGSKENWLQNLYLSASLPVGFEMKLLGNRRNYFGVTATAQPTYTFGNKAYLLTTDYKNYAKVPSLTRKFNVNAGFEMFAGFSTGSVNWRIGPQARYQVMSSYQERYPIKEHLFDFGLKFGVMLNK